MPFYVNEAPELWGQRSPPKAGPPPPAGGNVGPSGTDSWVRGGSLATHQSISMAFLMNTQLWGADSAPPNTLQDKLPPTASLVPEPTRLTYASEKLAPSTRWVTRLSDVRSKPTGWQGQSS